MRFIDRDFARRLELTDAYGSVAFARAHAGLFPEIGATSETFAGGWATFAGADSPITQAFALGLSGPVEEDEVARMEEFFRSRGAAINVELCPYADPSVVDVFRKRGYTLTEFSNVLARRLTPEDAGLTYDGEVRVRHPESHEARRWAETVARGFFPEGELPPGLIDLFITSLHSATGTFFLAEIDGEIIGGGVLTMHEGVVSCGGASTLPAFRGRGAQTALLRARLRFAAERGCDLAMVTTLPGTTSQRNAERQGFRVVYTRSKLSRQ
ncbi:MAG TPA: GNAT family N-acetyltransferase [Blastocatellia bacterium]|nr:GNAT family N-acetyltransferase [Blastocatellia bacterium]